MMRRKKKFNLKALSIQRKERLIDGLKPLFRSKLEVILICLIGGLNMVRNLMVQGKPLRSLVGRIGMWIGLHGGYPGKI